MAKSKDNLKPIIKDYLSVNQTLELLNDKGQLSFTVQDLFDFSLHQKITPVFLVSDVIVKTNKSPKSKKYIFDGYCICPNELFKTLIENENDLYLYELVVYECVNLKPFDDSVELKSYEEPSVNKYDKLQIKVVRKKNSLERSIEELESVGINPSDMGIPDDKSLRFCEEPTTYESEISINIDSIRFDKKEISALFDTDTNDKKVKNNSISDKTCLLMLGAFHKLLNEKKAKSNNNNSEPVLFSTKDNLMSKLEEVSKGIRGLSSENFEKYLSSADEVFNEAKRNANNDAKAQLYDSNNDS